MDPNTNNMIISSSPDDVVPVPSYTEEPKSKKKMLIIVGLILFIVLIACVVTFALTNREETIIDNSFNEEIVNFGNLLFEGVEDTNKKIQKRGEDANYYFDKMNISKIETEAEQGKIEEYYNKIQNHLDIIRDKIDNSEAPDDFRLIVKNFCDKTEALVLMNSTYILDEDIVSNYYIHNGHEKTSSLIQKTYGVFNNEDNINQINMRDALKSLSQSYLDRIKALDDHGCVSSGVINYECAKQIPTENASNIFYLQENLTNIIKTNRRRVINEYWEIYEKIN